MSARQRIFVSYSHADRRWLDEFRVALTPVVRDGSFEIWDDTRIRPGQQWKSEIEVALETCGAALLLASPAFLASEFIVRSELPAILNRARVDGLKVFWACISSCLAHRTELATYQALHDIKRPLDRLTRPQLNRLLAAMAERIDEEMRTAGRAISTASGCEGASLGPDLDLRLMPLAAAALPLANLTAHKLIEMLRAELASHPILAKIDYESVPRALTSKLFVVLTKQGKTLTVTQISVEAIPVAAVEAWQHLCRQHFEAYRLPFRLDHRALVRAAEYKRSEKAAGALISCLQRYYAATIFQDDFELMGKVHQLVRDVSLNLHKAEELYARFENSGDESLLGEVAIELDSAISAVHKLALAWLPNG